MTDSHPVQLSFLDLQPSAYKPGSPASEWVEGSVKHALDDLLGAISAYRSTEGYKQLMKFVKKFRFYSPFNGLLLHIQRPGAQFVAPAYRWENDYGRKVKPSANPLVILQPMGPVMFVYDVTDTEPGPNAKSLPRGVEKPFEPNSGKIGKELKWTIENAKRDGIRISPHETGSQAAGSIKWAADKGLSPLSFQVGKDKRSGHPIFINIPVRYELLVSRNLSAEAKYATVAHELAHLYCGHLGTPNKKWWPDRLGLSKVCTEFEAESVAHLLCSRLNILIPADEYLSSHLEKHEEVPSISLECVMKSAGLIEGMGRRRLKKRKSSD